MNETNEINETNETKKERNKIAQQKRRQRLIDEIGIDKFREQVREQVSYSRSMNKNKPQTILNNIKDNIIKLDTLTLTELQKQIQDIIQPPPLTSDNKIYCNICDSWIYKSNMVRHIKTTKHLRIASAHQT